MKLIMREVLAPLSRRLGTATGAFLLAYGVEQGSADLIASGVAAAVMVAADLVASALIRNRRGR